MQQKQAYELDAWFNAFIDNSAFNGLEIKNKFNALPQIVNRYRNILLSQPRSSLFFENKEIFTQVIELPRDCYYRVFWDISFLKRRIKRMNLKPAPMSTDELFKTLIGTGELPPFSPQAAANNDPIIVAKYPIVFPSLLVIDGNHRVVARKITGEPITYAYVLEPNIHLEGMLLDLHRVLYKIHHNLTYIVNYMAGTMDFTAMQNALYDL